VKTAFKHAVTLAKLRPGVSPHMLGAHRGNVVDAERYQLMTSRRQLGMSAEALLRVYGHHHPDHLKDSVAETTARPTASASPQKRTERTKTNVVKIQ
jgi:hypothetical protein